MRTKERERKVCSRIVVFLKMCNKKGEKWKDKRERIVSYILFTDTKRDRIRKTSQQEKKGKMW